MPVSNAIDGSSGLLGALCAVLFFDEQNPQDAVVIATFANGGSGLPAPPPGRVTFVPGFQQIHNSVISAGSSATFTLAGSGGIPSGALGVLFRAGFTSATSGASLNLAPHGASDITLYMAIGNIPAASATLYGGGLLALDAGGRIDIKANGGSCTVNLYTCGYVL